MKRKYYILSLLIIVLLLLSSPGCTNNRRYYNENDFIGLNSKEIIEKYGDFDVTLDHPNADGLYYHCRCGYITVESKTGYLGTTPPEYFMIYFDESGIAYECNYENGGWGG